MATNTTERSDILLLCLGPDSEKFSIKNVTVRDLFEVFSPFGSLKRIIIFKKKILMKAFLQYHKCENAAVAKSELHETLINDFGKAKLYFSALQELSFSNKYLEYKEYSQHESQELLHDNLASIVCKSARNSKKENSKSIMSNTEPTEVGSERGKLDHSDRPLPSLFNSSGPKTRNTVDGVLSEIKNLSSFNSAQNSKSMLAPRQTRNGISSFLLQKGTNFNSVQRDSIQSSKRDSQNIDGDVSSCPIQQAPSKVILVSNLFNCFDTVNELFSVFSCFGNIYKILLMKNLKKALVEYTCIEFAQTAQTFMNNQPLGSSKIKVNFSRYKKIDLKKNNKSENSQQFNEVMVASRPMHRYEMEMRGPVPVPCENLEIVCEKGSDVLPIDIYLQIQNIVKPQNFKVVSDNKENGDGDLYKIHSKFSSVQEALSVLSKCHNTDVKGLPLKISFAVNHCN
jgi:RNA recognition motif-containing protein